MMSSRAQWMLNIEALCAFGRPVVVELLGHGRSPAPDEAALYSPDAYVEQFELLRQSLGADSWFIVGQSLGAALTLRYSLDHPDRIIAQAFTNSNSALADEGWGLRVLPLMQAQAQRLLEGGRVVLDRHPLNPSRGRRLPPEARTALVADCALHSLKGLAYTGLYTVPASSVRSRIAENTVPALLVAGRREESFAEARRFAETEMPVTTVVVLEAGHAVNLESATEFNRSVTDFFARFAQAND